MNRQTCLNMLSNTIHFLASLAVSFFFTPFLIRELGEQAYGFVGLSESFTSYLAIITAAFNAMAGRFIAISFHKKDEEGIRTYLGTVFFTNILLSIFCSAVFAGILLTLEHWIILSQGLSGDVKALFFCVFLSFSLGLVFSVFTSATFCKNRLDLRAAVSLVQSVLRILLLCFFFTCLEPSLFYMGLTTLLLCLFEGACNLYFFRKLMPGYFPKCRDFKRKAVGTLVSAGIWNTVIQLGNLLLTGLDLLIANLFCGPSIMGLLAVSKSIPNQLVNFSNMLSNMFTPSFTELYAKGEKEKLIRALDFSCRMIGFVCSVPIAGIFIFGDVFYKLWLPSEDAGMLQVLTILGMGGIFLTASIVPLYNVFTVTNRLKYPALSLVCGGALSTALVFLLLSTTELGIYAVAGVSTAVNLIREAVFIPLFAAKCLQVKRRSLYKSLLRPLLSAGLSMGICVTIKLWISPVSWIGLIICSIICAVPSYAGGFFMAFSAKERKETWHQLKNKLHKR